MADDTEGAESDGKPVNKEEESLDGDYTVNEAIKEFLRKDSVFFNEFGKIV